MFESKWINNSADFSLKAAVEIWLLTLMYHTSAKGWPSQPLKERVPNIREKLDFWWAIPQKEAVKVAEAKKTSQHLKRLNFLHFWGQTATKFEDFRLFFQSVWWNWFLNVSESWRYLYIFMDFLIHPIHPNHHRHRHRRHPHHRRQRLHRLGLHHLGPHCRHHLHRVHRQVLLLLQHLKILFF